MTKLCASKNVKFSKMLPLIPLELHTLQYTQERASIYQASRITAAQNIWCPQAATPVEMRNTEGWHYAQYVNRHAPMCTTGHMGYCSSIRQTAGGRAELVYISAIELLSSVASPEEYLHYICSESKRDSLWRDIKQRLLFSLTLNVLGGSFCNEGAVVDYIPACKLYLFIHLWYFCVVSVLSAYRCYMEPLALKLHKYTIFFHTYSRWICVMRTWTPAVMNPQRIITNPADFAKLFLASLVHCFGFMAHLLWSRLSTFISQQTVASAKNFDR